MAWGSLCSERISMVPSGLGSTRLTASGRFLEGPMRPSGSNGFMLARQWRLTCMLRCKATHILTLMPKTP